MKKLNILMHGIGSVGSGIIRKFKESNLLDNIYLISDYPDNNDDCIYVGKASNIKFGELKSLIKEKNIDFVIIFDELYSLFGLVDYYQKEINIPIIGIQKDWFLLESSKIIGKNFFKKHNILTPDYMIIDNEKDIDNAISEYGFPFVIKKVSLGAGFGSHIYNDKKSAQKYVKKLLKEDNYCIAEKFINGKEISVQYFWDKKNLLPLLPVKDFKKTNNQNNGINTGGLGSYIPVLMTEEEENLLKAYNEKIEKILKEEKADFTGIFTSNLLFSENNIYTLEFNMRPGITEFETAIEHIESDLLELFYNCVKGKLENCTISYKNGITGCIAIAHKDYVKQKNTKNCITYPHQIERIVI